MPRPGGQWNERVYFIICMCIILFSFASPESLNPNRLPVLTKSCSPCPETLIFPVFDNTFDYLLCCTMKLNGHELRDFHLSSILNYCLTSLVVSVFCLFINNESNVNSLKV